MLGKRRSFSGDDKVRILKRHLVDKVPVSDLCDEHGLHPTLFYKWQVQLYRSAGVVEGDQIEMGRREIGGGLFRTDDGGETWKQVFDERMHVYAAAVDPENPKTVVINTFNSSAFRSDDRGETWRRLGGYNFKWGHRPVFDPVHPEMLFLTSFGGSVFHGPAEGFGEVTEDISNLPAPDLDRIK